MTEAQTMADPKQRQEEVDRNYEAFQKLLPQLLKTHPGKYAVMRHQKAVEFFDSARDAMVYGQKAFNDGLFSVQPVTESVTDLGYFSHAVPQPSI
jgi:hypothetical protein